MTGERHPTYGYMGFVRGVLEAQASAIVLRAEMGRQCAESMPRSALKDALWDGWYLLCRDAESKAREALSRGQILLCWDGTTVMNAEVAA